jgi:hypothetical protein
VLIWHEMNTSPPHSMGVTVPAILERKDRATDNPDALIKIRDAIKKMSAMSLQHDDGRSLGRLVDNLIRPLPACI